MEEAASFEGCVTAIRSGVACTVGVDFFYAAVRFVLAQEEPAELLLSNLADYHRTKNFESDLRKWTSRLSALSLLLSCTHAHCIACEHSHNRAMPKRVEQLQIISNFFRLKGWRVVKQWDVFRSRE